MRVTEVYYPGSPPVEGYGPGFFRVGGAVHTGAVALLPKGPVGWAGLVDPAPILEQAAAIDVLLIGMGAEIRALDRDLRALLEAAGIGVEIMATPPACRTYNVLLGEGRRVAAALLPV
ncbi:Mth938-like domain-containing protein [uncultured Amaricoccus sp.]|uniref:Mth938-like domain-containing protein n=1 Tax=uncultured Amaricoccus sp. TaxID=339341 RepID=UPI0026280928|nr:Mth938-like domain-containing protein [uncultured Amaricoccus sp.]